MVGSILIGGGKPSGAGIKELIKRGFNKHTIDDAIFLEKNFATSAGEISLGGIVTIKDGKLILGELQVFRADGGTGASLSALREVQRALADDVKKAGFTELKVIGTRRSGAKEGQVVSETIPLD